MSDAHITNETAQKIVNCATFKNLKKFYLEVNSERFNFRIFAEAMKVGYFWITF